MAGNASTRSTWWTAVQTSTGSLPRLLVRRVLAYREAASSRAPEQMRSKLRGLFDVPRRRIPLNLRLVAEADLAEIQLVACSADE